MSTTTTIRVAREPLSHDEARGLVGRTMMLVAATAGAFAVGAYAGRDAAGGWAILWFIASFALLFGIGAAARRSERLAAGLVFVFGLVLGLASAATIATYVEGDPQAVWEAAGATALLMIGFGAMGYATRRDLSGISRWLLRALAGLIGFGIVLIFVQIPGGAFLYAVAGLVIFAGLTLLDFQRLRRGDDIRTAPLLAASIFLDVLNVFELFLSLFSNEP